MMKQRAKATMTMVTMMTHAVAADVVKLQWGGQVSCEGRPHVPSSPLELPVAGSLSRPGLAGTDRPPPKHQPVQGLAKPDAQMSWTG